MPRGFGTPRAEVTSSCDSMKLRPVRAHCSPAAGGRYPEPVAGWKPPRPVAAGRWGQPTAGGRYPQPKAGGRYPQPVAIGRRSPKGF